VFETETSKDGVIEKVLNHQPEGYKPSTGIYTSSYIFQGNWENELEALNFTRRGNTIKEVEKIDAMKGQDSQYLYNAFRSADGTSTQMDQLQDFWKEENPADYKDTDSKLASPELAAICDWFQCEKTRIRIFQQQPNAYMQMHTDFDNQRGTELGENVRIFVMLDDNDGDFWFRFKTADSEVNIPLAKGQFLIFNPDHTGHQTQNLSKTKVRNAFMLIVKRNKWLDDLMKNETMTFIDTKELAKKYSKKVA
jgi:hypothetical protein